MNEQSKPNVTVIFQEAKSPDPGPVEVVFTIIGAIVMLAFFMGGCAR